MWHAGGTVRAGAVVVSVDYRLAVGGVRFPVPHDDVVAAWRWVAAQASRLGVDPARLCLGGASAGGNLAAGAALRVREDGDAVRPARLLLVYSGLHPVLPEASPELAERLRELPPALRFLPADVERIHANYAGHNPHSAILGSGRRQPAGELLAELQHLPRDLEVLAFEAG
jgi:acetyl esterase